LLTSNTEQEFKNTIN